MDYTDNIFNRKSYSMSKLIINELKNLKKKDLYNYLKDINHQKIILTCLVPGDLIDLSFKMDDVMKYLFFNEEIFELILTNQKLLNSFNIIICNLIDLPDTIFYNYDFLNFYINNPINYSSLSHYEYTTIYKIYKILNKKEPFDENSLYNFLNKFNTNEINNFLEIKKIKEKFNTRRIKTEFIKKGKIYIQKMYNKDLDNEILNFNYKDLYNFLFNLKNFESIEFNPKFIKKIATILDPIKYRAMIYNIEQKLCVIDIEEYHKIINMKLIEDLINNEISLIYKDFDINNLNPIDYYKYEALIKEYDNNTVLKMLSDNMLINLLSEYFFEDYYINISYDINELLKINNHYNDSILSDESYDFYKEFNKLDFYDRSNLIDFFYRYKDLNVKDMFYDDIKKAQKICYKDLTSNCFNFDKSLINEELSSIYGIPIYELKGEKFKFFLRCHRGTKSQNDYNYESLNNDIADGYSFSLNTEKNIEPFQDPNAFFITMYNNINPDNIIHVCYTDSYSSYNKENNIYASSHVNELVNTDMLVNKTKTFNEIIIINNGEGIKPNGLVCYKEITKADILAARKTNLPIILINTDCYNYGRIFSFYEEGPEYIRNYDDLNKIYIK